MADGRMLNKSISTSRQIKALASDTHRMLFAFSVPHLDREGRLTGEPDEYRALVCPLLRLSDEACDAAMWDFVRHGLAVRYTDTEGRRVLAFPGFRKQQRHMRKEREAESKFGDLTTPEAPPMGLPEELREPADILPQGRGSAPPVTASGSAAVAEEVRPSEEKLSEEKGREGNARAREDAPRIHCGDVTKIWNAVIRHSSLEEKLTNYRHREDIAEWANADPTGTGLAPRELLIAALRAFAAQPEMQRKGYPFLIFAAQPSSFLAASAPNGKPTVADRTHVKADDAERWVP